MGWRRLWAEGPEQKQEAPEPDNYDDLKAAMLVTARLPDEEWAAVKTVLTAASKPALWPGVKHFLDKARAESPYVWINPWTGRPD